LSQSLILAPNTVRSLAGSLVLAIALIGACAVVRLLFDDLVVTNLLINVVLVVGVGVFMGNSGISSFGAHAGFVALGAYLSGLLTVPASVKQVSLPNAPMWLQGIELPFVWAIVIALGIIAVVALVSGVVISRLPTNSAAIATLGVLIILHVLLIGSEDFTRGATTFYGVPRFTTLPVALMGAILAIVVARLYRGSAWGLQLRSAREDELAAAAFGANVYRLRLRAWILSAVLAAGAGVLIGHFITAFSPKGFYFALTFEYLVMLIIGGGSTVAGPVVGAFVVILLRELLRGPESGFEILGFEFGGLFGLTRLVLGGIMLISMFYRPQGLMGHREPDERLVEGFLSRRYR